MKGAFPPGPSSPIPFKLFLEFRRDPLAFIGRFREYGSVSHMRLAGVHVFLLCEDELIREVLMDSQGRFSKGRALKRAKALIGNGLLASEPPLHSRQKRLMMPAFHRQQIAGYARDMTAALDRVGSSWETGTEIDLWAEMMKVTQVIAAKTLFGADLEEEAEELSGAINALMEDFEVLGIPGAELARWLPIPSAFRFHRAKARLDRLVYGIIRGRRKEGSGRKDLLSLLLQATDEDGGGMSDTQVRDEVLTTFLAGHETTSNALTWTWSLLLENPGELKLMQEEAARVLGGREPGAEDYPRLEHCKRVFAESMRLYPPAWTVSRMALRPMQLGAWHIPKGSILMASQWLMQRDPRFWEEPLAFRPSRHTEEGKASRPAFSYFPFSAGPRGCIGEGFAWMEGVLLLARMAQKWSFEALGPAPKPLALITLRPKGGMRVRVRSLGAPEG